MPLRYGKDTGRKRCDTRKPKLCHYFVKSSIRRTAASARAEIEGGFIRFAQEICAATDFCAIWPIEPPLPFFNEKKAIPAGVGLLDPRFRHPLPPSPAPVARPPRACIPDFHSPHKSYLMLSIYRLGASRLSGGKTGGRDQQRREADIQQTDQQD
ncbi:hypothetical protein, partial [Rhodovulum visakhapatnamense]|uniref:hypothetical protein n=1 Tax=Rhodovulum visakhapatnamense TaxID=364297 RepID=UPI001F35D30F